MAEIPPTNVSKQDNVKRYEWVSFTPSEIEEDTFTIVVPETSWVVWMGRGNPQSGPVQAWYQAEKGAATTTTEVRLDWSDSGGTGNSVKINDLAASGFQGSFARYCTLTQSGNMPFNCPPGQLTIRWNAIATAVVADVVTISVIPQP